MPKLATYLTFLPLLLTMGWFALRWSCWRGPWRAFRWWLVFETVSQLLATGLALAKVNNLPLLYAYTPVGMVLLAWFYQAQFRDFLPPRVLGIGMVLFLAYCGYDIWQKDTLFQFNSEVSTLQSILVVMLSLAAYLLSLEKAAQQATKPTETGLNWINSGLFLYHASNLILFYFGELLMNDAFPDADARATWLLHFVFSAVMYLCFFIGTWKQLKPPNLPKP